MGAVEVRVGQVWADNDGRCAGRTLRVDAIEGANIRTGQGPRAVCTVLTNADHVQARLDRKDPWFVDTRGKEVRVRLDRFRPTSTGYRLVSQPEGR